MAVSQEAKIKTRRFIDGYINQSVELPIDLKSIIEQQDIKLRPYLFDNDLSGILIIENNSKIIGYDMSESVVRQRFTQSHELGHYVLHTHKSNVFMDKILFKRQSEGYSSEEAIIEEEANYFAANLLMPEILIRREANSLELDLHDEDNVRVLANKFNVSLPAMTFRLINLGII